MLTIYLLCINLFYTFFVTILFIVSIIRLFKVKPICHLNFWILLFQLHINLFTYSAATSTLVLFRHISSKLPDIAFLKTITTVAGLFSSFNNGVLMGTLVLISAERLIATIKNKTYETKKHPYYLFFGLLGSYGFGGVNICIWNVLVINYMMANICFYVVYFLLIMFVVSLYHKNKQLIKLSQSANILLTQRYQIHENVRMLKYAFPFLIYPTAGLIIIGAAVIILRLFNLPIIYTDMNDIYVTGSNSFILICFYQANAKIIMSKLSLWQQQNNRIASVTLNVNNDERKKEADVYFKQLKKAW